MNEGLVVVYLAISVFFLTLFTMMGWFMWKDRVSKKGNME